MILLKSSSCGCVRCECGSSLVAVVSGVIIVVYVVVVAVLAAGSVMASDRARIESSRHAKIQLAINFIEAARCHSLVLHPRAPFLLQHRLQHPCLHHERWSCHSCRQVTELHLASPTSLSLGAFISKNLARDHVDCIVPRRFKDIRTSSSDCRRLATGTLARGALFSSPTTPPPNPDRVLALPKKDDEHRCWPALPHAAAVRSFRSMPSMMPGVLGLPQTEGEIAPGASLPAEPPLQMPLPFSTTVDETSATCHLLHTTSMRTVVQSPTDDSAATSSDVCPKGQQRQHTSVVVKRHCFCHQPMFFAWHPCLRCPDCLKLRWG